MNIARTIKSIESDPIDLYGQFSIADRDSTTPQIKKVRVVSTVEYYLSDCSATQIVVVKV
jgi:hypothetical protein